MNPTHTVWIFIGALISFATSFIFADIITLPLDLYYLIYFVIIVAFFYVYIRKTHLNLREWFSRRLTWGAILGLVFAILMVQNVLSRPETVTLTGPYLIWSVFWKGFVYGAIDGLLLSSFPWVVTWRAFNVEKRPLGVKIFFSCLVWAFVLVITTAYHLGYPDFRSKKVVQANVGNTIMSLPTLIAANPVGSPITHAVMHMAAVIHSPETELFLPPHRAKNPRNNL